MIASPIERSALHRNSHLSHVGVDPHSLPLLKKLTLRLRWHPRGKPPLRPIVIAASGRSGTTLLMKVLATSDRIAFDRIYAYENAYISYLLTWCRLPLDGARSADSWRRAAIDHEEYVSRRGLIGGIPWNPRPSLEGDDQGVGLLKEIFPHVWTVFSKRAIQAHQAEHADTPPIYYAETGPLWVLDAVAEIMPTWGIHLVRDPRDQWTSIMAFNEKRGRLSFGVQPSDTPESFAARFVDRQKPLLERALAGKHTVASDRLVLHYEELVAEQQATVGRLSEWLRVDLSALTDRASDHATAGSPEASIGRWRHEMPEAVKQIFEDELGELVRKLGYD